MEELDHISPKDKMTFKEHYDNIHYALKKVSGKNGSTVSSDFSNQNQAPSSKLRAVY
ncbi:hypothetical protein [Fodinibius sediminis]|uniref:Uncharacterized protein n=1 Tax=Fodinibius sediminis TaxID=1214077 RepID=A0A521CG98_9BACT|nr:hypothetical protein [Fodinibius sediminis]SMO58458.1 hypothetical protein SAMN06265218_10641 [Fodinibius sediminis]